MFCLWAGVIEPKKTVKNCKCCCGRSTSLGTTVAAARTAPRFPEKRKTSSLLMDLVPSSVDARVTSHHCCELFLHMDESTARKSARAGTAASQAERPAASTLDTKNNFSIFSVLAHARVLDIERNPDEPRLPLAHSAPIRRQSASPNSNVASPKQGATSSLMECSVHSLCGQALLKCFIVLHVLRHCLLVILSEWEDSHDVVHKSRQLAVGLCPSQRELESRGVRHLFVLDNVPVPHCVVVVLHEDLWLARSRTKRSALVCRQDE